MENIFEKGTVLNLKRLIEYTKGGVVKKLVQQGTAGNITLFSFDKGQALTEHTSAFDVVLHVLDGKADVNINGKHFQVKKGHAIIIPANNPHSLQATQRFKMLLTIIKGENKPLPLGNKQA